MISVDVALDASVRGRESSTAPRIDFVKRGCDRLVRLFDEFDVPATWAIAGDLFGNGARPPPAPDARRSDAGSTPTSRDLRFGDDAVRAIRGSGPDHELACHPYAPAAFDGLDVTRERARRSVAAGKEAARTHGVRPASFTFPGNRVGHCEVLAESGFCCYRAPLPRSRVGTTTRSLLALVRAALSDGTPPVVDPVVDEYGLVAVPTSLPLFEFGGVGGALAEPVVGDLTVDRARRGIDAAARSDGVFHVWIRAVDLADDRNVDRLRTVLAHLRARRDDATLTVGTMHDIAESVRGDHETPVVAD